MKVPMELWESMQWDLIGGDKDVKLCLDLQTWTSDTAKGYTILGSLLVCLS